MEKYTIWFELWNSHTTNNFVIWNFRKHLNTHRRSELMAETNSNHQSETIQLSVMRMDTTEQTVVIRASSVCSYFILSCTGLDSSTTENFHRRHFPHSYCKSTINIYGTVPGWRYEINSVVLCDSLRSKIVTTWKTVRLFS